MTKQDDKKTRSLKRQLIAACAVTLVLLILVPTVAWFYFSRGLQTLTRVHAPSTLYIAAGHQDDVAELYLGDVDVTDGNSKDYVFCVCGSPNRDYVLQLAHTTNIPFTYTIYPATEGAGTVSYTDTLGTVYSYAKGTALSGAYLNRSTTTGLADSTRHTLTYGSYNSVQPNAEPLYWQPSDYLTMNSAGCDYYILTISWTPGAIENDKETDIVYLMAQLTNQ